MDGRRYHLGEVLGEEAAATVLVDQKSVNVEILTATDADLSSFLLRTGKRVLRISAKPAGRQDTYFVEINGTPLTVSLEVDSTPVDRKLQADEEPILVTAPMAGKIAQVKASAGAIVEEGQALVMLEAMKMENEIASPRRGRVKEVYVRPGALAKPGERLVLIE